MVLKVVTSCRPGRRIQGHTMVNTDQNDLELDSSTAPHNLGVMTYQEYYRAGLRRKPGYTSVSNLDPKYLELIFIDKEISLRLKKAADDEEEKNAVAALTDEVAPQLVQQEIENTELNDDVPAPTMKEDIVPVSAMKEDNVPVSATKDDDVPVPTMKEDNVPVSAMKEDNVPVSATKDDEVPVPTMKEDNVPVSAMKEDNVPVSATKDDDVPVPTMKEDNVPVSAMKEDNVPVPPAMANEIPTSSENVVADSSDEQKTIPPPVQDLAIKANAVVEYDICPF